MSEGTHMQRTVWQALYVVTQARLGMVAGSSAVRRRTRQVYRRVTHSIRIRVRSRVQEEGQR